MTGSSEVRAGPIATPAAPPPPGAPRRRTCLLTGAAAGLAGVLLPAAPALAHAAGADDASGYAGTRSIAVLVALVAVAAVSGPALTGTRDAASGRTGFSQLAAFVAGALAVVSGLGWAGMALAIGAAGAVVLVPPAARWRAVPASVLLASVAGGTAGDVPMAVRALSIGHVLAAAWWIGAVVDVAIAWRVSAVDGRRAARWCATPALGLVVAIAVTGMLHTGDQLGDVGLASGTWWGRGLALKVSLVAAGALLGVSVRRAWSMRLEAGALVGAAVIGIILAGVGGPLSGPPSSGPAFLTTGGATMILTPLAPGANTVLLRADDDRVDPRPQVDGRQIPLTRRADGLHVGSIHLAAGRHTMRLGGESRRLTVHPAGGARTVPATLSDAVDDPDCIDRLAGALAATGALTAAGSPTRLEVRPGDRCAVAGAGDDVSWHGLGTALLQPLAAGTTDAPAAVMIDGEGRGDVLAGEIRASSPSALVTSVEAFPAAPRTGPVVIATGPLRAQRAVEVALQATGGTTPIVLAPWLLDARLLAALADAGAPVVISVARDPTSPPAVAYRVAATAPDGGGLPPTAAGLEGFLQALQATGRAVPERSPGLFGMSRVGILPPSLGADHPSTAGWAPGLALVRVAG